MFKLGFSLIELLVVIVIILIAYSVVSISVKSQEKSLDLASIKPYLLELKSSTDLKTISLVCKGEKCQECAIFSQEKDQEKELEKIKLLSECPVEYAYKNEKLEQKQLEKFEIKVQKNKAINKMFIGYKDKFYIFLPLLSTKVYDSFETALKNFEPSPILPTSKTQFHAF